jgi:hypothetical protein
MQVLEAQGYLYDVHNGERLHAHKLALFEDAKKRQKKLKKLDTTRTWPRMELYFNEGDIADEDVATAAQEYKTHCRK